jgi:hypothetical protein
VEEAKEDRLKDISSVLFQEVYDKQLTPDTKNNLKTINKDSKVNKIMEKKSTEIYNNEIVIKDNETNVLELEKSESLVDLIKLDAVNLIKLDAVKEVEKELEKEILLKNIVTKNSLPYLTDDICLLPGSSPIVRVEEAPSNSR